MKKITLIFLNLLFLFQTQAFAQNEEIVVPKGYSKLVFQDEFSGEGLPDSTRWGYETGYVRNHELQYYVKSRVENSYQKDGVLYLNCLNDSLVIKKKTCPITSASIITKGKGDWKYGRVEVKAKLPLGSGTWPAIWMMPTDDAYGSWPKSGEIDILEHIGNDPQTLYYTIHSEKYHYSPSGKSAIGTSVKNATSASEWHIWALEWHEDRLEWFCDEKMQFQVIKSEDIWEAWPFNKRFYLILNFAFAGGWGGRDGYDSSVLPLSLQIDYVRVFQ